MGKLSTSLRCAGDEVGKLFKNTYDQSFLQLKSLTYIITDTAAIKEWKESLINVRDKFFKHAQRISLVVEHPKTKMDLEKNIKRKFESLSLLQKKINSADIVGVASEARKFLSNIKITEKDLKDLTKSETRGVPLSSADKNSTEALFLKSNAKEGNETQPKHSEVNILANIETWRSPG